MPPGGVVGTSGASDASDAPLSRKQIQHTTVVHERRFSNDARSVYVLGRFFATFRRNPPTSASASTALASLRLGATRGSMTPAGAGIRLRRRASTQSSISATSERRSFGHAGHPRGGGKGMVGHGAYGERRRCGKPSPQVADSDVVAPPLCECPTIAKQHCVCHADRRRDHLARRGARRSPVGPICGPHRQRFVGPLPLQRSARSPAVYALASAVR